MKVVLFFVDGLGIGRREPANPLFELPEAAPLGVFENETPELPFDGAFARTDPRMGVEGRPQSASGQTTILTGINAPALLGAHKQGFPNERLRELLREHSIFLQLKRLGVEPNVFANAYTPAFFTNPPRWKSATTVAVEAAEVRHQTLEDLLIEKAVFFDFTNQYLRDNGFDTPLRTAAEAGKILADISANHRFTLYEYFTTDKIGHAQNLEAARKTLPELAGMLLGLLENVDLEMTTVILTSDHGNIEDLSKRNHTLNDVPTLVWGRRRREIVAQIQSLADITPVIIETLKET